MVMTTNGPKVVTFRFYYLTEKTSNGLRFTAGGALYHHNAPPAVKRKPFEVFSVK